MTEEVQEPKSTESSEGGEPSVSEAVVSETLLSESSAPEIATEPTSSSAPVIEAADAAVDAAAGAAQRRSPWASSAAALRYIGDASATDEVQVRTSDRVTVIALLICCIAEVLSLTYTPMADLRLAFIVISDIVLAVAVIMFIVYRLGILSSLGKRQAIICWQLMMGCIFLGIFLCVNVAAGVALTVSNMYSTDSPADLSTRD